MKHLDAGRPAITERETVQTSLTPIATQAKSACRPGLGALALRFSQAC